jgi:hypothetical protein
MVSPTFARCLDQPTVQCVLSTCEVLFIPLERLLNKLSKQVEYLYELGFMKDQCESRQL